MIEKNLIQDLVQHKIQDTDFYLVDLKISSTNVIQILIENNAGVSLQDCIGLSKHIESLLDRETEDFELTVASAGISEPFKVLNQYHKHINKEVEVLTLEGKKEKGTLIQVTDQFFELEQRKKVKMEGKKKKKEIIEHNKFEYEQVKSTKLIITF